MSAKRKAENVASINIIDATNVIASPSTLAPNTMMENGSDNAPAANVAAPLMPSIPVAMMAPSPTTINEPTLPGLAKQINAAITDVDAATLVLTDKRINVAVLLNMAHDRMPARDFMPWCKVNIKLSKSHIYRYLALAKSDDPKAAHEAVKAADRERKEAAKPTPTVPEKVNSGTKALAAINASQAAPSNNVWNKPASQTRDKIISMQATALAGLKSYALADATVTQIRLLRGNDWGSISSTRRLLIIEEVRKLIVELEPQE